MLTAYMDESYNNRTMCVAGWLCPENMWPHIEANWNTRIDYENRISAKRGLKLLSRYKAADCASLVNEFEGWTVPRQVQLTKKLIEILARYKPAAFVFGATKKELAETFPNYVTEKNWKHCSYYMCMLMCLGKMSEFIHKHRPWEQFTVIHDQGPFNATAQLALSSARESMPNSQYIVTFAPMDWKQRVALQAADFIAYEGFKLVESQKDGREMRRSLRRMLGKKIIVDAGYAKPEFLAFFKKEGMSLPSV